MPIGLLPTTPSGELAPGASESLPGEPPRQAWEVHLKILNHVEVCQYILVELYTGMS